MKVRYLVAMVWLDSDSGLGNRLRILRASFGVDENAPVTADLSVSVKFPDLNRSCGTTVNADNICLFKFLRTHLQRKGWCRQLPFWCKINSVSLRNGLRRSARVFE